MEQNASVQVRITVYAGQDRLQPTEITCARWAARNSPRWPRRRPVANGRRYLPGGVYNAKGHVSEQA
jgi:hypothetical protein